MPTPHGDQGMAFSAHEVRVLRRALAVALRGGRDSVDFWLLGRAIGEAQDERERLRAFMTAELRRYRAALPGSAAGFLSCLRNAVDEIAHVPSAEDLAALRTTLDLPCGERERASRAALLRRCTHLAETDLEHRLAARAHRRATAEAARAVRTDPLDILIPTRPRPAPPSPTPAEHKRDRTPEPTPVPVAASEPEPRPTLAEAPVAQAADQTGPEATDDAMATTDVANGAEPADGTDVTDGTAEIVDRAVEDPSEAEHEPQAEHEAQAGPEAEHGHGFAPDAPASPEPEGAEVATDRDAENPNATHAPAPDPAPAAVPPLDVGPIRAALSPVIPHRRQGRPLGQLPAPEILQTGTG
ncbi:hypothetical protein ACIBSV_25600 [Embleya sp. NPDC050154]|uniref:hypothetical protein n=1 Tax=unclassified Embleya TaxID=2699296 RepID=UPI0037AA484A